LKQFYFSKYEQREPYATTKRWWLLSSLFQISGSILIVLGIYYLYWRWTYSMNWESAWFSVPLVLAETFSFISTVLVVYNYWDNKDLKQEAPARYLSEIEDIDAEADRPIRIDVFIATYNEDEELVRYSIRDAKKMRYPFSDVRINIWVLDDGRREEMKAVAEEEGVQYLSRSSNAGFKAGNLKNGLENSDGDLLVILDADTRPFPTLLEHTIGYFRNRKMAWVQTPQWFYDLTEPVRITTFFRWIFNFREPKSPNFLDKTIGSIKIGKDVFGNDPQIFYDVILRRRNFYNASFCCGAGSVHRRKSIMEAAQAVYEKEVDRKYAAFLLENRSKTDEAALEKIKTEVEFRPFVYHASEDIYTSLLIHAEKKKWQSYQHPTVECKMLSPQDLDTWVKQRTRYASGSLDIAIKNNPLIIKGLSLGQRINYFQTVYSYFAPIWVLVFLLSPPIFFFTLTPPVSSFNFDFFKIFIPFQIINVITMTLGTWGIPTKRADQYYISSFSLMLKSIFAVLKGEKVRFHVTQKTGAAARNLRYVVPHLSIIFLTILGIIYNVWLMAKDLHPSYSGFVANALWSLFNMYNLSIMILAAFWHQSDE